MSDKTNESINTLLKHLHDSRKGYQECAEEIHSAHLKKLFCEISDERKKMINEIRGLMLEIKSDAPSNGTMSGAIHRGFVKIKSLLTDGDEKAIIDEIKRGENLTIESYQQALSNPLPANIKDTLTKQLNEIKNNLNQIKVPAPI